MKALSSQKNREDWATGIAVFFHAIGLAGILFFDKDFFIKATPFNLLLSFLLLVFTHPNRNRAFLIFIVICILVGIGVEIIGVHTGWLFGDYSYGDVLGIKFKEVPVLIGVNWLMVMYCCGVSMQMLLNRVGSQIEGTGTQIPGIWRKLAVIVDGATLAVLLDWLMEPVAVKLGYWQWLGGNIPFYNYVCWFLVSLVLLAIFQNLLPKSRNKFAIHLLMIQSMFFLVLRIFL